MMPALNRSPATFTQSDVRRAIAGARRAGFEPGAVEITRDGTIRLLPIGAPGTQPPPVPPGEKNPRGFL
jgi:hypothetical protein